MKEITDQTIIRLEAENIKKLKAVRIDPHGHVITVGGKNAQGKTSTLDAIMIGLGGKNLIPNKPVRNGAGKGVVVLEMKDMIVKRTLSEREDGSYATTLTVTNREGFLFPSPQAMLDQLVGEISFDPGSFYRKDDRDQERILRDLTGLDFSEGDIKKKEFYDKRTVVARDLKALDARLQATQEYPNAPKEEQSSAAVLAEIDKAMKSNEERDKILARPGDFLAEIDRITDTAKVTEERLREIDQEIQRLQAKKNELLKEYENHKSAIAAAKHSFTQASKIAETVRPAIDVEELRGTLDGLQEINRQVRSNAERKRLREERDAKQKEVDVLTKAIERIEQAKAEDLASAPFPIKGLGFAEAGGITYNGIPLKQASGAEQLRVSVAIGLALNPKLKVLLIRDGSLLDSSNLALIASMAKEAGAQIWIEKVAEPGKDGKYAKELSVVIEDGEVVQVAEPV